MAHHDSSAETHTPDAASSRLLRRRLFGVLFVVLAIALLALIPPLLTVNRLQRRIVTSMSETLGRPVHIDSIKLHLLPVPGFTLNNLVISEDPAFGSEPVIRANAVTVRLRLSSLWRRQVEVSTIRFDVDANGAGPSLNIVRNPQGRWNLESLLMHASRVDAAPTVERKAGPAPRFPYIEATGARVNLKLGEEKMPFSLTDAEFALWLPTSEQWHVRLDAKPSRTDSNVADPGSVRVEGTFGRAATLAQVPLDLKASWHNAPLGEATRLLTGDDAGWRGTLHLDIALAGSLSDAKFSSKLTFDDLRRADFVPAQALDVSADCTADADITTTMLHNAACAVPNAGPQPLFLRSTGLDLQQPSKAPATLDAAELPLPWVLDWLQLMSPRIPADANPAGSLVLHFARDAQKQWTGDAWLTLQPLGEGKPTPTVLDWKLSTDDTHPTCRNTLSLDPTAVHLDGAFALSGTLSACGYSLRASGQSSPASLTAATQALPPLNDGLPAVLPATDSIARFDLTCTRNWSTPQTCSTNHPAEPAKKSHVRHR